MDERYAVRKGSRRRFIKREYSDENPPSKLEGNINRDNKLALFEHTDVKSQQNQQKSKLTRNNTFDNSLLNSSAYKQIEQDKINTFSYPQNNEKISENVLLRNDNHFKNSTELYNTFNNNMNDSKKQPNKKSQSFYNENYHPPNPNNSVTHVSRSPLLLRKSFPEPPQLHTSSHSNKQCFSPKLSQTNNFMGQTQPQQENSKIKPVTQLNLFSKNINYLRSSSKSPNPVVLNPTQHTKSTRSVSPSNQNQNYIQTAPSEQAPQSPHPTSMNLAKNSFYKQSSVTFDENQYKSPGNEYAKRNSYNHAEDIDAEFQYNKNFVVKTNNQKNSSKVYSDESKRNSLYENLNNHFSSSTSLNNLSNYNKSGNNQLNSNKFRIVAPYMMGVFDPSSNFLFNQKYKKNENTSNYTEKTKEKTKPYNSKTTEYFPPKEKFINYEKPNTKNKIISSTNFVITNQTFPNNVEKSLNRQNYGSISNNTLNEVPHSNFLINQNTKKDLKQAESKYNPVITNYSDNASNKVGFNQVSSCYSEVPQKKTNAKHIKNSSWNAYHAYVPTTIKDSISKKHSLDTHIPNSYFESTNQNLNQILPLSEIHTNEEQTTSNKFYRENNELIKKNEIKNITESDIAKNLNKTNSHLNEDVIDIGQKQIFPDKVIYTKQILFEPQINEFPIENLKVISKNEKNLEKLSDLNKNIVTDKNFQSENRFVSSIKLPTFAVSPLDQQTHEETLSINNSANSNFYAPESLRENNNYKNLQSVIFGNKHKNIDTNFDNPSFIKPQQPSQALPNQKNLIASRALNSLNFHSSIESEVPSTTTIDSSSIFNADVNQTKNSFGSEKKEPTSTTPLAISIENARKNTETLKNNLDKLDIEKSSSILPKSFHENEKTEKTLLKHQDSFNDPESPTLNKTLPLPKDSVILYHRRNLTKSRSQTSSTSSSEEEEAFRHLTPIQRRKFHK